MLPEEKYSEHPSYEVIPVDCILCEDCFETGCPALVWEEDYPHIRRWECVGCSMCAQLCPTDAIGLVAEA